MNDQPRGIRTLISWALLTAAVCAAVTRADDAVATLSRDDRLELWSSNIALSEQIGPHIPAVLGLDAETAKPRNARVAGWLEEHRRKLAEHEERRAADYGRYVENAKGHLEKDEVREALIEANRALTNASDEQALLTSDWIKRLSERAVSRAEDYRKEGEWRKAYGIFYSLTSLFENNAKYKKARNDCLTYARLDAVYEKDGKWDERLEEIVPRNATDALDRIDKYYVEKADLRAITQAGLEHLLLICDSQVMKETFPDLNDGDLRKELKNRLQRRLDRVRQSSKFSVANAKEYFRRVLRINEQTVDLPAELIVYEFISGALDPLDDFSSMIWPVEFREFDKHTRGDFVGVGISISGGGDRPINVVSPLEDTPAYRAGILADDKITHVNGASLQGISLTKAVQMITGPIGTVVTLTILRPSEGRSFDVPLKRDKIEIQSVRGVTRHPDDPERWNYILDEGMGIGYVRVASFQDNTVRQLRLAIDEALAAGARGLILDLRFNPGGLLKSAVEMTQLFQTRDEKVVSTRGLRDRPWSPPDADHDGPYASLPLVVLANGYSASASEIVSGALQDNKRAIIVGERTFGKFSVQKLMELGGSSAHLKLTTARYYLPLGRSLHHEEGAAEWGVTPTVEIKLVPKEISRIRMMQQDREILAKAEETTDDDADDDADNDTDNDTENDTGEPTGSAGDSASAAKDEIADSGEKADGDDAVEDDAEAVAEADQDDDDELNLAPDPNEVPDVDLQLDTAVLLMRLHLLGETTLRLAAGQEDPLANNGVQRP